MKQFWHTFRLLNNIKMEVKFDNNELERLFQTGKSQKLKFPPEVIKKLPMRYRVIQAAVTIYDFWKSPALKFEKLEGNNLFSMRINEQWRLELSIEFTDKERTVGKVCIERISNHYKK